MSKFTTPNPAPFVLAVGASITGAVTLVPAPAYAVPAPLAPPCTNWVHHGLITQYTYRTTTSSPRPPKGGHAQQGVANGGIHGNNISITIKWNGMNPKVASSNIYGGTINDNGIASGTDVNTQNNIRTNWHINEPFVCGR